MSRDVLSALPSLRLHIFRLAFTVGRFTPLCVARTIAYFIGFAYWLADARGRRTVARNLAHFIPRGCPEALARAVRRNYRDFAFSMSESFLLPHLGPNYFKPPLLTFIDPWKVFDQRPLPGPIVMTAVHCNWEMMVGVYHHTRMLQPGIEIIALSHGDPAIDALFERMRNAFGGRSLLLDRAPLASLRALKERKVVGAVGDRDYTGTGVPMPFAGEPLWMPIGPAALAVQTQAPVIFCFLARRTATRFVFVVDRPLRATPGAAKSEQVALLTRRLAHTFTRFIAAAPAQWVAFHDAWAKPGPR